MIKVKYCIYIAVLLMNIGLFAQNLETKTHTLVIIKPDAVEGNHVGEIIARFEKGKLKVSAIKMTELKKSQAMKFYKEHKEKPFYIELVDYMISGPIVAIVLEGVNAVVKNREIIGATNPRLAKYGTIRRDFGTSVQNNAVHGSDSLEAAKREISFFFKDDEVYLRDFL